MNGVNLAKIARLQPEDYERLRSQIVHDFRVALENGHTNLIDKQYSKLSVRRALEDFLSLIDGRPANETRGALHEVVLDYYARLAWACRSVLLLPLHPWVEERARRFTEADLNTARGPFMDVL